MFYLKNIFNDFNYFGVISHQNKTSIPTTDSSEATIHNKIGTIQKIQFILSKARTEVEGIIQRMQMKSIEKEKILELLSSVISEEAYYQLLTHVVAYDTWQEGDILPGSPKAGIASYTVCSTIEGVFGFKAIILVPTNQDASQSPLMLFRGTVLSMGNFSDDAHPEIGSIGFQRNKDRIKATLSSLYKKYGKVHVMGHSLGGAMAQRTVASFPHKVRQCTYFNAPGVGNRAIKLFYEMIKRKGCEPPNVVDIRHAKDLIVFAGREHIPPSIRIVAGTMQDPISHLQAHSVATLNEPQAVISYEKDIVPSCSVIQSNIQKIHDFLRPLAIIFEKNADFIDFITCPNLPILDRIR